MLCYIESFSNTLKPTILIGVRKGDVFFFWWDVPPPFSWLRGVIYLIKYSESRQNKVFSLKSLQ